MIITTRTLTINDTDQIIDIIEQRPEVFMGYSDDQFKNDLTSQIPIILRNPYYFNLGLFADGNLEGIVMTKEFTATPAWCWVYLNFRKTFFTQCIKPENFTELKKSLLSLDTELFNEMEIKRKLNRFFFVAKTDDDPNNKSRAVNSIATYDRLIQLVNRQTPSRISQYHLATDCVIESGEMAKYKYQQELVGNRIWPIKLRVCIAVMKPSQSLMV